MIGHQNFLIVINLSLTSLQVFTHRNRSGMVKKDYKHTIKTLSYNFHTFFAGDSVGGNVVGCGPPEPSSSK